jgi:PAS domain S-box-containing protein
MSQIDAELFKSFSDALPYGVCIVDLQGKIIYWNLAAEVVTGYMGHEVLGRAYRVDLLVHCEGAHTAAQCPVTEVLRNGKGVVADLFLRHQDGHRIPVHVFAFALRDSMGEMRGVGEVFEPSPGKQEVLGWAGHSEREFEMATGLSSVDESREQLQTLFRSRSASSSALMLIEMSEREALLQHGGTAMLHQAIRVLAKTVAGLLPSRNYVGCWSDWRLIAVVPECKPESLEMLKATLAGVGSSCAVKWWGDRLVVGIRAAARLVDASQTVDSLIQKLELDLKSDAARKE